MIDEWFHPSDERFAVARVQVVRGGLQSDSQGMPNRRCS